MAKFTYVLIGFTLGIVLYGISFIFVIHKIDAVKECGIENHLASHPEVIWYNVIVGKDVTPQTCGKAAMLINKRSDVVATVTNDYSLVRYCYMEVDNRIVYMTSDIPEVGQTVCENAPADWKKVDK